MSSPDVSVSGGNSQPPTGTAKRLLVVVAAGVLACTAIVVGAVAFSRSTSHGDPDPGGRILAALQSIAGGVPADATVVRRQDSTAQWSSCDGRKGTYGWTDLSVIITFTASAQPDSLVSQAGDRMVALGWALASSGATPIGPERGWTRTLGDGTAAHALLSPATADNGQTVSWELTAYAPPHGQRASGC